MKPEEHQSIAHIVALAPSVAPEKNFLKKIKQGRDFDPITQ